MNCQHQSQWLYNSMRTDVFGKEKQTLKILVIYLSDLQKKKNSRTLELQKQFAKRASDEDSQFN